MRSYAARAEVKPVPLKVPLTVKLLSDRLVSGVIIGWYSVDKPDD